MSEKFITKSVLTLLTSAALVGSLAACGDDNDAEDSEEAAESQDDGVFGNGDDGDDEAEQDTEVESDDDAGEEAAEEAPAEEGPAGDAGSEGNFADDVEGADALDECPVLSTDEVESITGMSFEEEFFMGVEDEGIFQCAWVGDDIAEVAIHGAPNQEGSTPEEVRSEIEAMAGEGGEEIDIADGAFIMSGNQLWVVDGEITYIFAGQTTQEDSKDHFIALAEAVTSN